MLLVFLLSFIVIISLLIYLLLLSSIQIEVKKLHILKNEEESEIRIVIKISFYLLGKLKMIVFTIDNRKIKKWYQSGKIDIRKLKNNQNLNKETIRLIRRLKYTIEKFYLAGKIGTENAAFTALVTTFINTIISTLVIPKIEEENNYYENIQPIYSNQNIVNLEFNCIITIKIVHIINILYIYLKKESVKKHERTSNRRTYAYSHE